MEVLWEWLDGMEAVSDKVSFDQSHFKKAADVMKGAKTFLVLQLCFPNIGYIFIPLMLLSVGKHAVMTMMIIFHIFQTEF